ncbi:MAG: class I SAM-dependent methyltransferase, partial [Planctomycetes bacterium]|nr:class I SAM-dependent methyltransferase [Planctomycetota bacterium]
EPGARPSDYHIRNGSFECVDGEILYSMIRHFKPAHIIEIGSGASTSLSGKAALRNREDGHACSFVAYEPYPRGALKKGIPGLDELRKIRIEKVALSEFSSLGANDILFIDSTHVLKIGSDVQYIYLEILPRLAKGVIVHIHDIFLPNEYP